MSTVDVREARDLWEVDAAYELAARVFGPNYFEACSMKRRIRRLEPLRDLRDILVVARGSEVVGMARVLDRQLHSTAGLVEVGGVTSVCIHPNFRGQGWGLRLMEAAIRRSYERGDVLSVLFARRAVDGWYPRLGYVGIGGHVEMAVEGFADFAAGFAGGLRSGAVGEWAEFYMRAYSDSYRNLPLSFYRDKSWWEKLDGWLEGKIAQDGFVNVTSKGECVGYFALRRGQVVEAAACEQTGGEFIAGMLRFFLDRGEARICLALPLQHGCVRQLRCFNHTLSVRYSWDGGHMSRVIQPEKAWAALGGQGAAPVAMDESNGLRHEDARKMLLGTIGLREGALSPLPAGDSQWPGLPVWSVIDEL